MSEESEKKKIIWNKAGSDEQKQAIRTTFERYFVALAQARLRLLQIAQKKNNKDA